MPPPDLRSENWTDLYPRLVVFATGILGGRMASELPMGSGGPDDLINESIALVLAGRRSWNPKISTFMNLQGIIRSTAYNWRHKKETTLTSRIDDSTENVKAVDDGPELTVIGIGSKAHLFNFLLKNIKTKTADLQIMQTDEFRMAEAILNRGCQTPKEIIDELEISESKFAAIKARLRRRIINYISLFPNDSLAETATVLKLLKNQ